MVAKKLMRGSVPAMVLRWASGLRFPALFGLIAALFLINLVIPDVIPFLDEILLGLGALVLANLRKKPDEVDDAEDSRGSRQ